MSKILIVDDSSFQRKILKDMIQELEHSAIEASSGAEALSILTEQTIDLICLDLLMPGMSGIEVLMELKKQPLSPPVIVISADIQVAKRDQCMKLGASAFINKYINKEELIQQLNLHLKK